MTIDVLSHLSELGFTDYEARAYATLVRRNPLTGYEIAKISGVPRPNVYSVLERLQQKGAVLVVAIEGGTKYSPVPPGEMLGRLSRSIKVHIQEAERALTQIQTMPQADYIWNIRGYENLMEKAETLIDKVQRQLLIAVWPAELSILRPGLKRLEARGITPTVLCFQASEDQQLDYSGKLYRMRVGIGKATRWLALVADESELLTAEMPPEGESRGAWTKQELFVAMATWYVRHSIAVAEIVRSVGPGLLGQLDASAMAAVGGASLATLEGKSWLEGLLQRSDGERVLSR